jgi:hypothetical protein
MYFGYASAGVGNSVCAMAHCYVCLFGEGCALQGGWCE